MLKIIFRNTAALKINRNFFVWQKLWRDAAPLKGARLLLICSELRRKWMANQGC